MTRPRDIDSTPWLHIIDNPGPELAGADPRAMLEALPGPVALRLPGARSDRCRVAVTLLHGNEPSGLVAVHRLLAEPRDAAVDLWIVLGAIDSARAAPGFAHRFLPGRRDLNRVFDKTGEAGDPDLGFAASVLDLLERLPPIEALVDIHNNTGRNPSYAIATRLDPLRLSLASLFASRYIETNLRLGTLIEVIEDRIPSISLEVGRAGDPAADECAHRGLSRFARLPDLEGASTEDMTIYDRPIRVELRHGASIDFAPGPLDTGARDLVLTDEIDRHNFGLVERGTHLGWIHTEAWPLPAYVPSAHDRSRELFERTDGQLRAAADMIPIMMTLDPEVAVQDCLFYVVRPRRGGDRA